MQLRIDQEARFLPAPEPTRLRETMADLARAGYALATERGSIGDFLERLCLRAQPVLERGRGIVGCVMSVEADICRIDSGVFVGCPAGTYEALCSAALAITPAETARTLFQGAPVGIVSERLAPTGEEYLARRELAHLARAGIVDHLFIRLPLPGAGPHKACFLFVPCPVLASLRTRERAAWTELGAELGSALRLNGAIQAGAADQDDEASPSAILKLCKNGSAQRANPERAIDLWRALLDGSWSIVSETNARGKRVLLVRRKSSQLWPSLTEREKRVARSVLMGQSNKTISFDLGISPAATTAFVGSALRKLGLRSRSELSGAFRAHGPQAEHA